MTDTLSAVVSSARPERDRPALYVGLSADAATSPARIGLGGVDRVDIGRADATRIAATGDVVECALADARLSQRHARLTRVGASWLFEDLESKNGSWLRGRRITRRTLVDGDVVIVGHTALVYRATGGDTVTVSAPAAAAPGLETMSAALAARFAELAVAARGLVTIEITGETGTGKELVARAVHALSGRAGELVAVNCGAIASSLFEAELFGHAKGAYTGATDERRGLIRTADRGTLFLDEIAELPPASQTALLRVLQDGEVTPVGADRPVKVELRVITATHQDLDEAVAAGRFRADLRARLLGFQIELPALRDRLEDLALVIPALLARIAGRRVGFSVDALGALYGYEWPLNIRELERALVAAAAVARDRIELQQLPTAVQEVFRAPEVDAAALSDADRELRAKLVVQFQDKWKFGAYTSSMLTHDARRFVHIDNGGVVRIADLDTGTRREVGHLRDIAYTLDTSADGHLVAAGGRDGTARIIDLETGAERAHFECHGIVWNLSFSRDATKVAAACGDGQVRILELATGHVRELAGHSGAVAGVDFTRDGTGAISSGVDGTVRLWNLASGLGVLVHRAPGPITGARFVGDSSLILDRSHDARMLRLWDSKALPTLVPASATLMPWLAATTTAEVDERGVLATPP